jgi:glycosyltransferase involved in cell wall biosynthesis
MTRTVALMIESSGPGGAEQVVIELAEELRRRGIGVCTVGPAHGPDWLLQQFRSRGFEPEVFRLRRPVDPSCAFDLRRTLKRRGVSVIHSHEFTMAVYGTAVARMLGLPHVITMHGGRGYQAGWRRRVALRWACRRSISVGVSRSAAHELERSLRLAPGSVRVVLNGIRFTPGDRARGRAALGLEPEAPLILAVGSLYAVKGHTYLLQALQQLAVAQPALQWHAAIAGRGGREETSLREFLSASVLSGRVKLLGHRADVPDLLAAADIYVMPSLSEGMPLALVEAMFARKAIVASLVGGIPEVVSAGREALLVPPEDPQSLAGALGELLRDPARREALAGAAEGRARAEFDVAAMADAYERLYWG